MSISLPDRSALELAAVLGHPGFVELSQWSDFAQPWAVGIRFRAGHPITWFRGAARDDVLAQALRGIEVRSGRKGAVYNWRDRKETLRPCTTPGCQHQTQTDDPRCHFCREGRKPNRRAA